MPPPPPMLSPFMMQPPFAYFTPPIGPPPPMPLDLTKFSDEELLAMEGTQRKHIEERLKVTKKKGVKTQEIKGLSCNHLQMLRNTMLMLDSASILMQQYQGIMARLPQPTAAAQCTQSSETSATSVAADVPNIVTSASVSSQPAVYDNPSTSREAAAAATAAEAKPNPQETQQKEFAKTTPLANVTEKVTIEDLGAEEEDVKSTHTESMQLEFEDNSELSELRKRRLKFLEEHNKSSTGGDTTD